MLPVALELYAAKHDACAIGRGRDARRIAGCPLGCVKLPLVVQPPCVAQRVGRRQRCSDKPHPEHSEAELTHAGIVAHAATAANSLIISELIAAAGPMML